jgi:type I restriction enzyme S subunit
VNPEIKDRIAQIKSGQVPEGYKKIKSSIIPHDWEFVKVKNVLKRIRNAVDVQPDSLYRQIGIRSHGKGIFYKEVVSGAELGNKSVFWIEPDCFIVNIVFAWEMAVAKTTVSESGMIASHRFPMYKVKKNKLDLDYITYFFKSSLGKELLGLASPGGAGRNKTLGQHEFSELEIPIPKRVSEQQKIAAILTACDKGIALQQKMIIEKKAQKKCLMQKLLTGEKRLPGFSGKWEKVKLGDIGEFFRGHSYDGDEVTSDALQGYLVLRSTNIQNNSIDLKDVTRVSKKPQNEIILKTNDIIICMANGSKNLVGKAAKFNCVNNQNITVGAFCSIFRSLNPLSQYLFQTDTYNLLISKTLEGTNINNLKNSNLSEFEFFIPSENCEQIAIAKILSTADSEIELLEKELVELQQQKKGLMQLLLTGIVRINLHG